MPSEIPLDQHFTVKDCKNCGQNSSGISQRRCGDVVFLGSIEYEISSNMCDIPLVI